MLNINVDVEEVAVIIQEVADSIIVPRFKNLGIGDIHFKAEDDPVTIADQEAEKELSERLIGLLGGSKVVGEEAFASDSSISSSFFDDSPVWTIDPVDGTKAFIAGQPFYGVIVALTKQNHTVAAWLYDPTSKEFITAQEGAGAYHNGKKLSVLPATDLKSMTGILGASIKDVFEAKGGASCQESGPTIDYMRSACHDYARLVAPKAHFSGQHEQVHFHSWLNTCTPWDCAAGVLIHQESGGYTAHWNGELFSPADFQRGILSAPNKESWRQIRDWISSSCTLPE